KTIEGGAADLGLQAVPAGYAQHLGLSDGARTELMEDLLAIGADAVKAQKQPQAGEPRGSLFGCRWSCGHETVRLLFQRHTINHRGRSDDPFTLPHNL